MPNVKKPNKGPFIVIEAETDNMSCRSFSVQRGDDKFYGHINVYKEDFLSSASHVIVRGWDRGNKRPIIYFDGVVSFGTHEELMSFCTSQFPKE